MAGITKGMNHPAVCIEQLDLAAKQLGVGMASYDRFALILTDNAVELLLHSRCDEEFQLDQAAWRLRKKYTTDERKEVLGHRFPSKVKFCVRLGVISQSEADFIINSHKFRNELYHVGIRHDQILHGLAWHYHELTCLLLGRIEFTSYGWHSGTKVSKTVELYVEDAKSAYATIRSQLPTVAKKLAGAKPAFDESLGRVLSNYLVHRLDDLRSSLDYLVADNPNQMNESNMIEHVQMYNHIHGEDSRWQSELANCQGPRDLTALWKKVRQSWKPPVEASTFPLWRTRAENIAQETHGSMALRKYVQLDREMADFEHLVHDAAIEMSIHLDT
jgi:hypothetical protein